MKIDQKLQLRQSQNLIITQQLKQSLEILQLPSIELEEYIDQELEKNPFLTKEESEIEFEPTEANNSESTNNLDDLFSDKKTSDEMQENYPSNDEIMGRNDFHIISNKSHSAGSFESALENSANKEKSLKEHLLEQINIDIHSPHEKLIAIHLLDFLSEAGYLQEDYKTVAENLGGKLEDIEIIIRELQKFDPPGIFARNLKECLALQLQEKELLNDTAKIILNNLDLVALKDIDKLCRYTKASREEVLEFINLIKTLNPKPGNGFSSETTQVVIPDIYLKKKMDGSWYIELNNEVLPRVLLNKKYCTEILDSYSAKGEKKYINEQISNANSFVKAVNQRAETILKVATELVKEQEGFFNFGIAHLKSMTLKDIAEKIDMHESTISRVVNNKYIATSRGIYELKYFFSSGVPSSEDSESGVSSNAIKFMIKELIDQENKQKPLSDDKIVELLSQKAITIARRTVTKYREALKIPGSSKRKSVE